ncbi:MAG: glycoside hydrolase [Paludibacter sp.]|nr:glycoside hydrolase [Paludibacter sp.]
MRSIKFLAIFLTVFFYSVLVHSGNAGQRRIIQADYNKTYGTLNTMFKNCVGAGRANEGLRADWQQQLAYVKQICGFRYIRMHGLLSDDMGVYREDKNGNPEYNFQYIDVLYDFLHSIGMKPFVELGFMPSALASGPQTIFWWRGNVTPPKDYNKWADLIKHLVQHFTERYGTDEVKTWYFEVWNEPNLSGFWTGNQADYFKLYTSTANAIKSINKDYRVGGPATAGAAWVPEMIRFCVDNSVSLDFISTHTYGVKQGFLDEYGHAGTVLSKDPMSVNGDVVNSKKQIETSDLPGLELHYTEWSSSYTPSDPIHDSYHEAAYILQKIKQVDGAANSMSYWTFTDIFEEAGPRFTSFHGGFGLLNLQGINKPAFYAYKFMNQLGNMELQNNDSCSWICKDQKGNIQILFWNFTNTHPGDSVNNQIYYAEDLPSKGIGKVKLILTSIPKGKYKIEAYKVGYRSNDPYTTYLDLCKPSQLTRQQIAVIKKKNDGSPLYIEKFQVDQSQTFVKEFNLRENDVYFVNLIKQ